MEKSKTKTVFFVAAFVLVLAILSGTIIYTVIQSSQKKSDWELFIDAAPVDYSTEENYFFVLRFKDSAKKFISSVFNGADATVLVDRVVISLSKARIPAEKLGAMATAIAQTDINKISQSLNNMEITEDNIMEFMQITTMEYIAQALHEFFSVSGLTEEEFSRFLYEYLKEYSPKDYIIYLDIFGKENFIAFFSNSIYLINTLSEIKETGGENISNYALQAVFYQLGSVYLSIINDVGVDVVENVLCFDWSFEDQNGQLDTEKNALFETMQGKIGLIAGVFGSLMKELDVFTIKTIRDYILEEDEGRIKSDKQIYSQMLMAKSIKSSLSTLYSAKTGIADFDDMVGTYLIVIKNAVILNYLMSGGNSDDEIIIEACEQIDGNMARYKGAIEYLSELEYTYEEISNIEEGEYYEGLVIKAKEMNSMKYSLDYFIASLLNIWINNQAKSLELID